MATSTIEIFRFPPYVNSKSHIECIKMRHLKRNIQKIRSMAMGVGNFTPIPTRLAAFAAFVLSTVRPTPLQNPPL